VMSAVVEKINSDMSKLRVQEAGVHIERRDVSK
jgi:hypothetical protein